MWFRILTEGVGTFPNDWKGIARAKMDEEHWHLVQITEYLKVVLA